MAKEGNWISARQIEAARIAMTRFMKRGGGKYILISFPHLARTKKAFGDSSRCKGKGSVDDWVAVVKEGKDYV